MESLDPTLHFVGDTFEDGFFGARNKYIHTVGVVGKVKFVPASRLAKSTDSSNTTVSDNSTQSSPFTGHFAEGSDYGLIRLSLAKKPDTTKTTA